MPDPVGKDDVIARGVEQRTRPEQHARELESHELPARAAGAVEDQHRVADGA